MNKGCLIAAGTVLLLLTAGLIYYFVGQSGGNDYAFKTIKPEIDNVIKKAVATGSIKPRLEVQIKPQVSGVIDKLYMEAGQKINKGEKIAKIKLVPSQVNINNAQSNVELARIRVKDAERELERQLKLANANLDVEQTRVEYENAQKEFERQKGLFGDGVISQQEYDRARLDSEVKRTAFENTKISSANTIDQLKASLDIRKQELDAAISNLQLLREGVTRNSKQVSNIVVSTVDGMILDIPIKEGSSVVERNNFNEGTSIAVIADMKSLMFEGKVDESDVGKIKEGMPLILKVGAIEDMEFNAVLDFISPKGELEEGTVKFMIRASLKPYSEDVFLRAGYSANADVILSRRDSVIVVNERDVLYVGDSTFVELSKGDQDFERLEVKLGLSDGVLVEVESGVDTSTLIKMRTDPSNN